MLQGALEVHGTFDVCKWGWDSRGFTPGANGQQTQNLPSCRGGSHPPGGGTGATGGSWGYHIPTWMSRNSWAWEINQACLMLQVPLPLCPWLWPPMVTHPRTTRDPGKGLSPKACQPPIQVTPANGSGHISRKKGRYQDGGDNSSSSATQVPKSSVNGRSRTWQEGKLWPSSYLRPNKKRSLARLKGRDFLPPSLIEFQGSQDIRVVRQDNMVALAWALQQCTMQSGAPLGTWSLEARGNWQFRRVSHCMKAVAIYTTWIYWAIGRQVWPTLEDADSPISTPLGAQLDLGSLGSMQVVISHNPVTGEVWYWYQSRVVSLTSL